MKIKAHPGLCQGHGLCKRFAPEVYQLDDEGYIDLHLVEVPPELEGAAAVGASVCPAGAITIIWEGAEVGAQSSVEARAGSGST